MGFLERIAGKYLAEYGNKIHRLTFVFPTRRARLYFQRYLEKQKPRGENLWVPRMFSLGDFIVSLSHLTVAEPLELVFELYGVYRRHVKRYPKEFGDFYPWGKMIIADFDEIDKYLVDARELFRTLKEFKAVEDINIEQKSPIYNRYTGFWEELDLIYQEFNRLLRARNKAYEGMVYREVAGKISGGDDDFLTVPGWDRVVFCGFNALTVAEASVISHLLKNNQADIYWDMDEYFVKDKNQEAGHFFRLNQVAMGPGEPMWVEDRLSGPRKIKIIGVQSSVSQAKVMGLKLDELMGQCHDAGSDPENIAVVLPDETLLFPVLNSLPASAERINITIGFPLQQTPVYSLLDAIIEMQLHAQETRADGFYHKHIQKILNHPYIRPLATEEVAAFVANLKKNNQAYCSEEEIRQLSEPLRRLFLSRKTADRLIDYFLDLLEAVRRFYMEHEIEPDLHAIDYEYFYHFYTLLSRLKESLVSTGLELDTRTFRQLFTDIVAAGRVPFTGEPLQGVQVMGMLETQTLDFKNVFILSLNEGKLPPGKTHQSFIPFDVRKKLNLPTYEDRDAIAAYHFYRLLKNAENVFLLYVTEARGMEKSEKSRFIDQVAIEFTEKNKRAQVEHQVIDFSFDTMPVRPIIIPKSPLVMQRLFERVYSASTLVNYLTCSLRFYFHHILRLREEEDIAESPDYRLMGEIIHETLHRLYKPYVGKEKPIDKTDIETIELSIEPGLIRAYKEKLVYGDIYHGRNHIAFKVMKEFLERFIEKEKSQLPFQVIFLEKRFTNIPLSFKVGDQEHIVQLEGVIDRLDKKNGIYRIIDYKTGKVEAPVLDSMDNLTPDMIAKKKEIFQLLFYRYILKRQGQYNGEFQLGIYPFKRIGDKLMWVEIGDKGNKGNNGDTGDNKRVSLEMIAQFEKKLEGIFAEIFEINEPFKQTEDESRCRHCPYVDICVREEVAY